MNENARWVIEQLGEGLRFCVVSCGWALGMAALLTGIALVISIIQIIAEVAQRDH